MGTITVCDYVFKDETVKVLIRDCIVLTRVQFYKTFTSVINKYGYYFQTLKQ